MRLEEFTARLRGCVPPGALERVVAAWPAARRRPETLLAAVLVIGVVVMIMHWS